MLRTAVRRIEPRFPEVYFLKGRGYVLRSALNQYKAESQAFSLGVRPVPISAVNPDSLVPLMKVAGELGIGRRTAMGLKREDLTGLWIESGEPCGSSFVTKAMETAGASTFKAWADVFRALVRKVYIAMSDAEMNTTPAEYEAIIADLKARIAQLEAKLSQQYLNDMNRKR